MPAGGRCDHRRQGALCGRHDARAYMTGQRCPEHTPAALAGRPEVQVDPEQTLVALKAKAGRATYVPPPAVASGRRRSNTSEYRQAQKAEHQRRLGELARRRSSGNR